MPYLGIEIETTKTVRNGKRAQNTSKKHSEIIMILLKTQSLISFLFSMKNSPNTNTNQKFIEIMNILLLQIFFHKHFTLFNAGI